MSTGLEMEVDACINDFTDKTTTGTHAITMESTVINNGSRSMKVAFDGVTSDVAYAYKTIAEQTGIYVRGYFRINALFLP
ncbi:unnamed protein product, partial [marine sediment metagenome]